MSPRHFLALADETPDSFRALLDRAAQWKKAVHTKKIDRIFDASPRRSSPLVLAMIFLKPSNRTRVSFELAMHHMGGKAMYLSPQEIGLGKREATKDVAAVLGRYVDGIMARVYRHADVVDLAKYSGVPVVNGLSDREHPCQGLGDFQTILEQGGRVGRKTVVTFIGDGNNVSHSLMLGAALLGMTFRLIGPKGYEPGADIVKSAIKIAKKTGAKIEITPDLKSVAGSGFIYTDVWTSMGDEDQAETRRLAFDPYRLDSALMRKTARAKVLHCLPAHRGEEITDDVIDSPDSVVLDQAENRLYAQMAVLERVMMD